MVKYIQGIFKPKNPQKYEGDVSNIVFRSNWERIAMNYFDKHKEIVKWCSEEIVIPYYSPIDMKFHRYFVDFKVTNSKGQTFLIEVKPFKQTIEPKKGRKPEKRFLQEVETWGVNTAKWEAARTFCKERGWLFVLMTERELGIK